MRDGAPLALAYESLVCAAHDEVRLCGGEVRLRVPAKGPGAPSVSRPLALPVVLVDEEIGQLVHECARQVRDRGADLSGAVLRAVTRLLQFGSQDAAVVPERADRVLPGAGLVAGALRDVAR